LTRQLIPILQVLAFGDADEVLQTSGAVHERSKNGGADLVDVEVRVARLVDHLHVLLVVGVARCGQVHDLAELVDELAGLLGVEVARLVLVEAREVVLDLLLDSVGVTQRLVDTLEGGLGVSNGVSHLW
jgi:hypothetical protein